MGIRPYYGDWSKGSFLLTQDRQVYKKDFYPPKELSLKIEHLSDSIVGGEKIFMLKVTVNHILDKRSADFQENLLFSLNLLQENIGSIGIYPASATNEEITRNQTVAWEILPIGQRDVVVATLLKSYKRPTVDLQQRIIERRNFLESMRPQSFVYGFSGIRRYFGALYADNLVVFENLDYGNAVYIMFENWRDLSQLSRTELLKKSDATFERIPHRDGWQAKVRRVIRRQLAKQQ